MTANTSALPIVQSNSRVAISFRLSVLEGPLVDEATAEEPLEFSLGDGTLLPNLEEFLVGLELGTQGRFIMDADDAFGRSNPDNIQTMPRANFPAEMSLEEGQVIGFNTPTGQEVPGTILQLSDNEVEIDFNHPLADATLEFVVKIEAVLE